MQIPSYALHIAIPVVVAGILNGIIFALKLNVAGGATNNKYLPPGYAVGMIWIFLFGLLGFAHFRLYSKAGHATTLASAAIVATIAFCLAYPILTSSIKNPRTSRSLNIATLVIACVTFSLCCYESPVDSLLVAPLVAWAAYVNYADSRV